MADVSGILLQKAGRILDASLRVSKWMKTSCRQRDNQSTPPLAKGDGGGFYEQMLSYDKQLKVSLQHLRRGL